LPTSPAVGNRPITERSRGFSGYAAFWFQDFERDAIVIENRDFAGCMTT
jgi:hypothetical protein